jgi:hypothetical protein
MKNSHCRLCEGLLSSRFSLKVLQKYNVEYFQCNDCLSLQTEYPFWLNEAYSQNISYLDTGAVQRNLHNLGATFITSKLFNSKNIRVVAKN